MHALLSFMSKLGIDHQYIARLPAKLLRCDAELVLNRTYPLLFTGSASGTGGSVCVRGRDALLRIGDAEPEVVPLAALCDRLAESHAFVYALVHRRNALVLDSVRGYGLIQPTAPGRYLDPDRLEYTVRWTDGSETPVPYAQLDERLQPLGGRLHVAYSSAVLQHLRSELAMPDGGTLETSAFSCNLFYPNGEHGGDEDFGVVYVNVPCFSRREGSALEKGLSEVYKVPLSDLVLPDRVRAGDVVVATSLWIGL
jgi:hypothetical protein